MYGTISSILKGTIECDALPTGEPIIKVRHTKRTCYYTLITEAFKECTLTGLPVVDIIWPGGVWCWVASAWYFSEVTLYSRHQFCIITRRSTQINNLHITRMHYTHMEAMAVFTLLISST